MALIHDPATHAALKQRAQALRPNAVRRWGKMTVDQMLWDVNESFRMALGDAVFQPMKVPPLLPKPVLRWMVLNIPWPKGRAPTYEEMRPGHHTILQLSARAVWSSSIGWRRCRSTPIGHAVRCSAQ